MAYSWDWSSRCCFALWEISCKICWKPYEPYCNGWIVSTWLAQIESSSGPLFRSHQDISNKTVVCRMCCSWPEASNRMKLTKFILQQIRVGVWRYSLIVSPSSLRWIETEINVMQYRDNSKDYQKIVRMNEFSKLQDTKSINRNLWHFYALKQAIIIRN